MGCVCVWGGVTATLIEASSSSTTPVAHTRKPFFFSAWLGIGVDYFSFSSSPTPRGGLRGCGAAVAGTTVVAMGWQGWAGLGLCLRLRLAAGLKLGWARGGGGGGGCLEAENARVGRRVG